MDKDKINYVISKRKNLILRLVSSFVIVTIIIVLAIIIPAVLI